ncbi:2156_t:CDS:2 [Diversispora eburnea]|uniref:2156_t:CDS:1 n=1 Tax=Diversispora eburnea TaxID=1213867 RepID=A0A9N8YRS7_9GLOM|nr:2156_t:CDS:2 [Diversispora eburnea]
MEYFGFLNECELETFEDRELRYLGTIANNKEECRHEKVAPSPSQKKITSTKPHSVMKDCIDIKVIDKLNEDIKSLPEIEVSVPDNDEDGSKVLETGTDPNKMECLYQYAIEHGEDLEQFSVITEAEKRK